MAEEEKKVDYAPSPTAEEGDDADPWLTSVDDEGGGGAVPNGKARAGSSSAAARASGRATAWNPIEEVDSALLSGLIDARERKALYRLEQSMIEFMKDDASSYMEVGGAYNAIVVKQSSIPISEAGDRDGEIPLVSRQGLDALIHEQQRGQKQTSFQRLILHRLADRFGILREQINNVAPDGRLVDAGGITQYTQNFSPGLIRLVKTDGSSMPRNLIIDVDLSLLTNYRNPRANRNFQNGYGGYASGGGYTNGYQNSGYGQFDDGTAQITDQMGSATLGSNEATAAAAPKKSKKKMVIMKRDSSTGDAKDKSKSKGKKKTKKKIEDKEKAYEEARARIFGDAGGSGEADEGGDEVVVRSSAAAAAAAAQDCSTPQHSRQSSFSAGSDSGSPDAAVEDRVASRAEQSPGEADSASRSYYKKKLGSGSNGGGNGGRVRAVVRNPQQEANDPDFRRRNDVRPRMVQGYNNGGGYGGYGGHSQQQQGYGGGNYGHSHHHSQQQGYGGGYGGYPQDYGQDYYGQQQQGGGGGYHHQYPHNGGHQQYQAHQGYHPQGGRGRGQSAPSQEDFPALG